MYLNFFFKSVSLFGVGLFRRLPRACPVLVEEARGGHEPARLVVLRGGGARARYAPHVLAERDAELLALRLVTLGRHLRHAFIYEGIERCWRTRLAYTATLLGRHTRKVSVTVGLGRVPLPL